jgi:hypothetical protein
MKVLHERQATLQVAPLTIVPFVVGLCATQVTMAFGEQYGLVAWCAVLGASAAWLNWAVFRNTKTLLPFLAAVVVILLIWSWQKYAFAKLVPGYGLTYGYFLKPEGAEAGFWVLTCPFRVGLICLSVCFVSALVSGWRAGFRRLLACMIPWWFTAFLISALPSAYLDAPGNASVFI